MTSYDVVVIGGGHNGLVCAATLAKSGRKVLVLEAASELGGAARTDEFAPGFRVSSIAHVLNRLHPEVVKTLDLESHGLELSKDHLPSIALSAKDGPLTLSGAYGEGLIGASSSEQVAWKELRAQLFRYAGILKPFLSRRPPDLHGMSLVEKFSLGQSALALKKLGKEDMRDFLRVLLMNVADLLDEQLTDNRLKGLACLRRCSRQSPRTTLADLAHRSLSSSHRRDRRRVRRADRAEGRHGPDFYCNRRCRDKKRGFYTHGGRC